MTIANQTQSDFWSGPNASRWIAVEASNERLFTNLTQALLDGAGLSSGTSVLDVGCGTGGSTIAAARRVGDAPVAGLDISEPFVARARERAAEAGVGNAFFIHGDAQITSPGGELRFDRMISRFGMMFFADPVSAFRNIAGALRPGGTMTFLCWTDPAANPWFSVPRRIVAERFGPEPPPDPTAPGPFAFADADRVLGMLSEAGLDSPEVTAIHAELEAWATVEEALEHASLGPIGARLEQEDATQEDREAMIAAFGKALEDFLTPDGVRVPARCNLYTARVE